MYLPRRPWGNINSRPALVLDHLVTLMRSLEVRDRPQVFKQLARRRTISNPGIGDQARGGKFQRLTRDPISEFALTLLRIVLGVPIAAMAQSATIAPRVQIYTRLICAAYHADIAPGNEEVIGVLVGHLNVPTEEVHFVQPQIETMLLLPPPDQSCREDNDVLKAVARLITSEFLMDSILRGSYKTVMSGTMGILSCVSTVWWGQVNTYNSLCGIFNMYSRLVTFGDALESCVLPYLECSSRECR